MSDIYENISESKSGLSKLIEKIPGLGDFIERNDRRIEMFLQVPR